MTTSTLRPDATIFNGGSTVTGAATRHAATNDDSDASYVSNTGGVAGRQHCGRRVRHRHLAGLTIVEILRDGDHRNVYRSVDEFDEIEMHCALPAEWNAQIGDVLDVTDEGPTDDV